MKLRTVIGIVSTGTLGILFVVYNMYRSMLRVILNVSSFNAERMVKFH